MATVCYMSGDKLVEIEAPTEQEAERLARAELGEPEHKGGGTKYEDKMLNRTAWMRTVHRGPRGGVRSE